MERVQFRALEGHNRSLALVYLPCERPAEFSALAFPLQSTKSFGGAGDRQMLTNAFAKRCRVTRDMRSHACCWGQYRRGETDWRKPGAHVLRPRARNRITCEHT